jgi:hypothetical protein
MNTAQKMNAVNTSRPLAIQTQPGAQARPKLDTYQRVPQVINGGAPGGINTNAAQVFRDFQPNSSPISPVKDGGAKWLRNNAPPAGPAAAPGPGSGGTIIKQRIIPLYANKYAGYLFNAPQYKRGAGATTLAQRGGIAYNPYGDAGESFSALEGQAKFTGRKGAFSSMANTFSINPATDSSAVDTEAYDFMKERALQRSIQG